MDNLGQESLHRYLAYTYIEHPDVSHLFYTYIGHPGTGKFTLLSHYICTLDTLRQEGLHCYHTCFTHTLDTKEHEHCYHIALHIYWIHTGTGTFTLLSHLLFTYTLDTLGQERLHCYHICFSHTHWTPLEMEYADDVDFIDEEKDTLKSLLPLAAEQLKDANLFRDHFKTQPTVDRPKPAVLCYPMLSHQFSALHTH